jgi:phage terminase large subunit
MNMAIAPPRSSKSKPAVILAKELRPYQRRLFLDRQRFNCWVCHRRFGKSALTLLLTLHDLTHSTQRQPRYAYIAPLFRQAKAIAWDMLSRYASVFDDTVINQAELRIDFPNGGQIRLYGADNPDSLRGIYLDGVVFDEYAQMRPRVWHEVVRPALADRGGWAVFIGTPLGHNHFYDLYQQAQQDPAWHAALYTVEDTGVIPPDELESARRMMAPEQFAQEWLCSFESALVGSYYGSYLDTAREEQRITRVPWEPQVPVHTAWDLGISDATAIWFVQSVGRMLHVIDYLEASDVGLEWYAKALKDKPYTYGRHYFPHDIEARDFSSDGRTRLAMAEQLGLKPAVVVPRGDVADGIQAVRTLFPRFVFDSEKCYEGIECLKAYRREWSETRKAWLEHPLHDFASHAADALRTFAMGYQEQDTITVHSPTRLAGTMPTGLRQGFWFR